MVDIMKKNVLIIDLEYYAENANTLILDRLWSALDEAYNVTVGCFSPQNTRTFNKNKNIIKVPYYSLNKQINTAKLKLLDYFQIGRYCLKSRLRRDGVDEKNAFFFVKELKMATNIKQFDMVISVSNPFSSHIAASIISKTYNIPWIAYYFDPFFSNATLCESRIAVRKKREEYWLRNVKTVLMTYPTDVDYQDRRVNFAEKIIRAEMPGIRTDIYKAHNTQLKKIECYFIGNLYSDIRNPQNTINLFSLLEDFADLYFVGGYYGEPIEAVSIPKNVFFLGKKEASELDLIYERANVLVNIGNSIINQMPSKIFEYISTGKPIVNIYKDENCPTLRYLKQYELSLNIFENDIINHKLDVSNKLRIFLEDNADKIVDINRIKKDFNDNTYKKVAETLTKYIEKLIGR